MKNIGVLFYSLLISVGCCTCLYIVLQRHYKKTAVVDAVRLFDQFHMKKEMEAKEKAKLEALNKRADSIGNQLQLARAAQKEEQIKQLAYTYNYARNELETEFKEGNRAINEQVWKRLNPEVNAYGKEKGLHLIIGANGMGSVLYTDDYYDLTDELIKYVNKKYEEGN